METQKLKYRYTERRNQLFKILIDLQQSLAEVPLKERLFAIEKNLKNERFRLVVLGQFKRGKTTFINALLGEALLPTDVIPVTAVITEIRYGEQNGAVIHFHEGEPLEASIMDLPKFITEEQNPANEKMVDRVIVTTPAKILENGLILVDTPGVGSVHEHNTRLTQEYLPQVDAAIFLFSADPPLTELEVTFLKTILPLVPHVEFVLNKKDYLNEENLKKVLRFNREQLTEIARKDIHISAISALNGLEEKTGNTSSLPGESGLPELEQRLQAFLVTSRGRTLILSNADRINRVCQEWQNLRALERKAQHLSITDLQTNLSKFTQYMETISRKSDHLQFLLDGIKIRLLDFFDQTTKIFISERTSQLQSTLEIFIGDAGQRSKHKVMHGLEVETNNQIIDHFEPFRLLIEKQVKEKYADEVVAINQEVKKIVRAIYRFSAELFDAPHLAETEEEIWRYRSQFYYKTWDASTSLDLIENNLITLLPRALFNLLQRRHVRKNLPQKLERQCGRLRADILYGLQENNRQFLFEFNQVVARIKQEISSLIESQLQKKRRGEKEQAETVEKYKTLNLKIEQIMAQIEEMKHDP